RLPAQHCRARGARDQHAVSALAREDVHHARRARRARPGDRPPGYAACGHALNVQTHFAWLRTRLAAERTLMAWNRTSLSLIGFGFTIYQFFEKLQEATGGATAARPEAPRNLGLAFVIVGTLGTLVALWQYLAVVRYLKGNAFQPNAA